jgi:hypothetical protein
MVFRVPAVGALSRGAYSAWLTTLARLEFRNRQQFRHPGDPAWVTRTSSANGDRLCGVGIRKRSARDQPATPTMPPSSRKERGVSPWNAPPIKISLLKKAY